MSGRMSLLNATVSLFSCPTFIFIITLLRPEGTQDPDPFWEILQKSLRLSEIIISFQKDFGMMIIITFQYCCIVFLVSLKLQIHFRDRYFLRTYFYCHGMTKSVKVHRKDQSVNKNAILASFVCFFNFPDRNLIILDKITWKLPFCVR